MDWNRVEGNWKQVEGKVKEKWSKLTNDDLAQINGKREQLEGKIQARYGLTKDVVRQEVDNWLEAQHHRRTGSPKSLPITKTRVNLIRGGVDYRF